MKHSRLLLLTYLIIQSSCALSESPKSAQNQMLQNPAKRSVFVPKEVILPINGTNFALIDVIELPKTDYQVDLTVLAKGAVDFPFESPIYTETKCDGIGYTVSYESKRRSVTSLLKVVPYVDQIKVLDDHKTIAPNEQLILAIYAEYQPIEDYYEKSALPSDFVRKLEPSNHCHMMCAQALVKPTRQVLFNPPAGINCAFGLGYGDDHPGYIIFNPANFNYDSESRKYALARLEGCNAVESNEDLKNYYKQATEGSCFSSNQMMFDEWYYVEQKIPYKEPVYSITNYSSIIKTTSETQSKELTDRVVAKSSDWQ